MITVNTNVASLRAQRNLNKTMGTLKSTVEKLSSGFRINKAKDDAAGLAISEEMKGDIRSLSVAKRNAADGQAMLQTAESGMDDITGMLQRLRELAMQSSSDGVTDSQRSYISQEVTELQGEIDRIAGDTTYNDTNLLDGSFNAEIQIGLDGTTADRLTLQLSQTMDASSLGVQTSDFSLSTKADAQGALAKIDSALATVSKFRATVGAKQNRLDVISNNISAQHEALSDSNSRIRDVDIAEASAQMTRSQILQQSGAAMLAQANSFPQIALSLLG